MNDTITTVRAREFRGRVESVLLTVERERGFETAPVKSIYCVCGEGVWQARHWGPFREVGEREVDMKAFGFPLGTRIANERMFSAVSKEDLRVIADGLGLAELPYGLLGENLVVSGIPALTLLPPNTRLFFEAPDGTSRACVLTVHGENKPCVHPARLIQSRFPDVPDIEKNFKDVARGWRGVLGTIYATGHIDVDDTVIVKVPKQRLYQPMG